MIKLKSAQEIELMRQGGVISSKALKKVLSEVKPGVTLLQLDKIVEDIILASGALPSFKTVDDYKYSTCINVNAGIVHGLPNEYKIKSGDVVSVDLGVLYKGFHTDLSYTLEVDTNNESKFLETGKKALEKAISWCKVNNKIGDISATIQEIVENEGYTVSEMLVGHGVGKELHEDPYVPCYGHYGAGPTLKEGMVLAVEVIYQKGKPDLALDSDNWTYMTADGSLSGLFEKTVAITANGPLVITNF